jgi:hypothetical protein
MLSQEAGEFVVLNAAAYHSGFNQVGVFPRVHLLSSTIRQASIMGTQNRLLFQNTERLSTTVHLSYQGTHGL